MQQRSGLWAVLVGGSIAAALDILFAISFAGHNGVPAIRLLQTVASGVLGSAAFLGGASSAALGMALHFFMSYLWAGIFFPIARHLPAVL